MHGDPLPFATVYVKGTSSGTATNPEGLFELNLASGDYELIFQYVGFKKHSEFINITDDQVYLEIKLQPDQIELSEVVISADAEDPAYRIIRNAMEMRKYYLNQVEDYKCNAYTKGIFRMTEAPEVFFGDSLNTENDSILGIFYLSESESIINFQQPNLLKEEMISSKISGDDRGFSFNFISFFLMDFYKNKIAIPIDRGDRGFISPIANNALFYYKYHLEGTFLDDTSLVNKIKVIPKRKIDPVFNGYIYIIEDSWRIHSVDLAISKDAEIDFIDSIRMIRSRIPVNDTLWMAFSQKLQFYFSINMLGKKFGGNGIFHSQFTDYQFNNTFKKNFFSNEIIKIDPEANKKDSLYWEENRQIPLTIEEKENYHKEDSLWTARKIREDTSHIDWPKFRWGNLMDGYSISRRQDSTRISVNSPLTTIQFNTVLGWNVRLGLDYSRILPSNLNINIDQNLEYGFSNNSWYYSINSRFYYNRNKFSRFTIAGGIAPTQYNPNDPISPLLNTAYSLFVKKNFMKIYQKSFIDISHYSELTNGVYLTLGAEYADRKPMVNTTDYTWARKTDRDYTSNNPQEPLDDSPAFKQNQLFLIYATLKLVYKQKYISVPEKVVLSSKWPTLSITYQKAINGILGSDMNFDLLQATIDGNIRYGLLGQGRYMIAYGHFLNNNTMEFIDWHHYNGNRTIVAKNGLNNYSLLDYYDYSTDQSYVEAAYEHHFNGFVFNKLPLVRKLKWRAVTGFRFFSPTVAQRYTEINAGVENIFKFLRVDFVVSFESGEKTRTGVVFRLYL